MDDSSHSQRVRVTVTKHLPLGLHVELDNGQTGIVRVREIAWDYAKRQHWRSSRPIGWSGWAVPIKQKDHQQQEFSLRLAENDPWDELPEKLDKDQIYEGIVTGVVNYGAFIELASGLTGLLHQTQLPAWVKSQPLDLFWPGDRVRITLRAIDRHNRHISLGLPSQSPAPGEGRLPRQPSKDLNPNGENFAELEEFLRPGAPQKYILIVEDEPEQRAAASNWLKRIGQRVEAVENAELALERMETSLPDLLLVDIGLPGINGAELTSRVLERWPGVRVVCATDWARADDIMDDLDRLRTRGAELIPKPLLPEDLISILKKTDTPAEALSPETQPITRPSLTLKPLPGLKLSHAIQSLLGQCRRSLGFEQAILFSLDPIHRVVHISERSGDSTLLNRGAISQLIFSPVRDVAEDHDIVISNDIQTRDRDRFRYLLEIMPNMACCIGVPVMAQTQQEYALFVFDRHQHQVSPEQKIFVEAIALALGTLIEQGNFKEQSMLIQRTALIGHITRAMVHEINNLVGPLASRLENLQFSLTQLEKKTDRADLNETRNQLISSELIEIQKYIKKIISTTRMFGRITAKDKSEILRVDEIIAETIKLLGDTSDRAHVTVVFNPPPDLLVVRSQAAALEQVLLNTLLNAVQQISEVRPDSGGWIQVRLDSSVDVKTQGFFRILIEDSGPGVHASLFEKIFEPGYTTRHDGSGIGLYISRNLVGEMGGRIYVYESCILSGTTFAIEIPAQV